MLLKKEPEELLTQKIICYGTVVILLLYLLKFVRYFSKRSTCLESREDLGDPIPCARVRRPPRNEINEERRPKRQRRRRHHRYIPEHWLPRDPCHNHDGEFFD
ncbi:hypothetical protein O3G_MSEX007298 [Manduca sexta]|uniref:Uncharacterized protein n=1 Tax=Manduca sexta TaxID=7130 RepID=A0A921Z6E2_MANSE|nr:hypothetical protein O3G_MSEX007298 [Manduca sexta]